MSEPHWLVRVVECFSNETDALVGEFVLPPVELAALQGMWNAPPDEPMVDCYRIGEAQAQFFRELAGIEFDFDRCRCFLSAYTTDSAATRRERGFMGKFVPPKQLPAFPETRRAMPKTPS